MKRLLAACLAGLALLCALPARATEPAPKTLRYAFRIAETGFDPVRISDIYSRIITAHIFEALYSYDPLARPAKIVPVVADGDPEVSPDFKTFTIRLRHGIYFADDPAFKGSRREVTAADFVYSFKRFADPATNAQGWSSFEEAGLLGLTELRERSLKTKTPFPYDTEVAGLRALDRYTLQLKTQEPRPRLVESLLAGNDLYGAVAREVVAFYGDKIMEHPVGTGPFVLKTWRRSSQMVLERNPDYRERHYEAQPAPDDAEAQAIYARLKGRRIPMIDRVVVDIIEETQPRWLSFLNGQHNFLERVPEDFITQAAPGGKLAPNLAKRGMHAVFTLSPDALLLGFNMEDPVVGGYTPDKVALRRAIGLAYDTGREIRLVRRGQALPAQSMVVPYTTGFDPAFKSEMGDVDPGRAKALLDLYGYTDKDGDGWRDLPDGKPLVLVYDTLAAADYRERDEVFKKNLDAIGIKLELRIGKWPEQLRASRAGKLMMWGYGLSASSPNSAPVLALAASKQIGGQNHSRFKNEQFDRIYDRIQLMPDGPERDQLIKEAQRILIAYMPIKVRHHRIGTDLMQPWVVGYKRHPNAREFWKYVDIDTSKLPTPK